MMRVDMLLAFEVKGRHGELRWCMRLLKRELGPTPVTRFVVGYTCACEEGVRRET